MYYLLNYLVSIDSIPTIEDKSAGTKVPPVYGQVTYVLRYQVLHLQTSPVLVQVGEAWRLQGQHPGGGPWRRGVRPHSPSRTTASRQVIKSVHCLSAAVRGIHGRRLGAIRVHAWQAVPARVTDPERPGGQTGCGPAAGTEVPVPPQSGVWTPAPLCGGLSEERGLAHGAGF